MKFFQCTVRKPGNSGKVVLAVIAVDAADAEASVHLEYGAHLEVLNIVLSGRRSFQIGGELIAIPA